MSTTKIYWKLVVWFITLCRKQELTNLDIPELKALMQHYVCPLNTFIQPFTQHPKENPWLRYSLLPARYHTHYKYSSFSPCSCLHLSLVHLVSSMHYINKSYNFYKFYKFNKLKGMKPVLYFIRIWGEEGYIWWVTQ